MHVLQCIAEHVDFPERTPALNGSRSLENMCCSCCCHPRNMEKPTMMNRQPSVKLIANFDGERMIVGRKMVKASSRKIPPAARKLKKYASCCPVGMLAVQLHVSPRRK